MPLTLYQRSDSPYWWIRGTTAAGRIKPRSTKIDIKQKAEANRYKTALEKQAVIQHTEGHTAETFSRAVILYLEQGGSERFLDRIVPLIGHKRCSDIDQNIMDDLQRVLYPDCKPSTIKRQLYTPVTAVLKKAAFRRWCPPPMFEPPKGANKLKEVYRWLTPEEFELALMGCTNQAQRTMLTVFVGTGLRRGNAHSLRHEDIYGEEALIYIGKQGIQRRISLQPRVLTAIRACPYNTGPIIRGTHGEPYEIDSRASRGAMHRIARRAGIDPFGPHDLRHTWATWHYAVHKNLIKLRDDGHWADTKIVERYAHTAPDSLADELKKHGWFVVRNLYVDHDATTQAIDIK
ncbi:MAG: tyrosine-type recombinase/integrase [Aquisalinus sp.]|nr:tyrosine-type recombinase/integrase [Aquisalinus sp.]